MILRGRPEGRVWPPSSKSISHRALICAALSDGGNISKLAVNDDTDATIRCLKGLGAQISKNGDSTEIVSGVKAGRATDVLDCGESGSTLRFIMPVAAALCGEAYFSGRGRLMERPMSVYEKCFPEHGVNIEKFEGKMHISGKLRPGTYRVSGGVSSQFISGLLFALPLLEGDSEIVIEGTLESSGYIDLTLDELARHEIKIVNLNYRRFVVRGNQTYIPTDRIIESDYSGAAFFLAASALGCNVEIMGLSRESLQGDRAFLDVLEDCGCRVITGPDCGIVVDGRDRHGAVIDVSGIPDLVPPMAALMALSPGVSRIENAARLRMKESDRLATVTQELCRLGANVTEGPDYLVIAGRDKLVGGRCCAHGDHRIAMMCALASLKSERDVYLDEPDCVKKSYPDFWKDFMGYEFASTECN